MQHLFAVGAKISFMAKEKKRDVSEVWWWVPSMLFHQQIWTLMGSLEKKGCGREVN